MMFSPQLTRMSLAMCLVNRQQITVAIVVNLSSDYVIGPHGLLSSKARILVTNSIAFLKQFDRLAFIRRGIILEDDTYENCMLNEGSELRKLVWVHLEALDILLLTSIWRSKEHGTGNASGSSTPFHRSGAQTPRPDDESTVTLSSDGSPTEKSRVDLIPLYRGKEIGTAVLAQPTEPRAPLGGMSQEHSEQGQVKREVYLKYLQAASKSGFAFFLLFIVIQQMMSVAANLILRSWGEHNRATGDNSGRFDYLLAYGLSSLASVIFSASAAVVIWVFCSVRSARYLHDSVSYVC